MTDAERVTALITILGTALEFYAEDEDGGDTALKALEQAMKLGYTVKDAERMRESIEWHRKCIAS